MTGAYSSPKADPRRRTVRVVLVGGQSLIRAALRMAVEASGTIEVVGEAAGVAEAEPLSAELGADIVLVDVDATSDWRLPFDDGRPDGPRVVFLAGDLSSELVGEAVRAGGFGIVSKGQDLAMLERVVGGEVLR